MYNVPPGSFNIGMIKFFIQLKIIGVYVLFIESSNGNVVILLVKSKNKYFDSEMKRKKCSMGPRTDTIRKEKLNKPIVTT